MCVRRVQRVPAAQGMWSLKPTADSSTQKYIVFSFVGETRVLGMTGEGQEHLVTFSVVFFSPSISLSLSLSLSLSVSLCLSLSLSLSLSVFPFLVVFLLRQADMV